MVKWDGPKHDGHGQDQCLICLEVTNKCNCWNAADASRYVRCQKCKDKVAAASTDDLRALVDELYEIVHSLSRHTITYRPMSERRC